MPDVLGSVIECILWLKGRFCGFNEGSFNASTQCMRNVYVCKYVYTYAPALRTVAPLYSWPGRGPGHFSSHLNPQQQYSENVKSCRIMHVV